MADTLRIRSDLPIAHRAVEPLPDEFKEKPGLAPTLRSVIIKPGMNEFTGPEAEVYNAWAKANPGFVASDEDVKNGLGMGKISQVKGDVPDQEFGFQPALDRISQGDNASVAAEGSMLKEPGPAKASDMAQTSDVPNDISPRSQTPSAIAPVVATAAVKK